MPQSHAAPALTQQLSLFPSETTTEAVQSARPSASPSPGQAGIEPHCPYRLAAEAIETPGLVQLRAVFRYWRPGEKEPRCRDLVFTKGMPAPDLQMPDGVSRTAAALVLRLRLADRVSLPWNRVPAAVDSLRAAAGLLPLSSAWVSVGPSEDGGCILVAEV